MLSDLGAGQTPAFFQYYIPRPPLPLAMYLPPNFSFPKNFTVPGEELHSSQLLPHVETTPPGTTYYHRSCPNTLCVLPQVQVADKAQKKLQSIASANFSVLDDRLTKVDNFLAQIKDEVAKEEQATLDAELAAEDAAKEANLPTSDGKTGADQGGA